MARKRRVIVEAVIAGGVLLAVVLLLPHLCGTRFTYVDVVNGDVMHVTTAFGLTYGVETNATPYSLLVERLGLRDVPDWRLAGQEELGIRKWFCPHVCFKAGKILAEMAWLPIMAEIGEVGDPTEKILELRAIAQGEDGRGETAQ
jgi:hypothetical protein